MDTVILDIYSEEDDEEDTKKRFGKIINNFCESLINFAVYVRIPTETTTELIHKKKNYGKEFAVYIDGVELFNSIILQVVELMKKIIISLNILFVHKKLDHLIAFLDNLRNFLVYLLKENVFDILNNFKRTVTSNYKQDLRIMSKITKVKTLIFKLFDISLDITSIFIPQVMLVKGIVVLIEEKTDSILDKKIEIIESKNIKVDLIIKQLLDIQLRSQIILSLNINHAFMCLINKESDHLIRVIENLQTEYVELLHVVLFLKNEIFVFKSKKKSLISNILSILGK